MSYPDLRPTFKFSRTYSSYWRKAIERFAALRPGIANAGRYRLSHFSIFRETISVASWVVRLTSGQIVQVYWLWQFCRVSFVSTNLTRCLLSVSDLVQRQEIFSLQAMLDLIPNLFQVFLILHIIQFVGIDNQNGT